MVVKFLVSRHQSYELTEYNIDVDSTFFFLKQFLLLLVGVIVVLNLINLIFALKFLKY